MTTRSYDAYVPTNWDDLDADTRYKWLEKHVFSGHVPSAYRDALRRFIEALRHDLATSEGLWCVDHQPETEPDAFQLTHQSLGGKTTKPDWSGYAHLFGGAGDDND
jgi:hypothetical protein